MIGIYPMGSFVRLDTNELGIVFKVNPRNKTHPVVKIIFDRNGEIVEYPFWNQINGPIEDALWHCGQVVSFRRSSGNPYNSKANVFTGKVRE